MADKMVIRLVGETFEEGRIPVHLLTKVLNSVQTAIFAIGEFEQNDEGSLREGGPVPKKVKSEYTLELVETVKGSFVAALDLPEHVDDEVQTRAFDLFEDVMTAVGEEDTERLVRILPDRGVRNRILKSVVQMIPLGDDYTISFKKESSSYTPPITDKVKQSMNRLLSKPNEAVREVVGRIVELKIIGDSYIGVYHNSKIIKCTSADLENMAYQSIGKDVILKGEAILNDAGEIKELVSVSDVFIAEPGTLPVEEFVYGDSVFSMADGFSVELDYVHEYWTISHEELGIYVSESKFSDAIEACYAEIEFLYEDYVQAPDAELTTDAKQLKAKVERYVESVVAVK